MKVHNYGNDYVTARSFIEQSSEKEKEHDSVGTAATKATGNENLKEGAEAEPAGGAEEDEAKKEKKAKKEEKK